VGDHDDGPPVPNLSVVSVPKALAGQSALVGVIRSGKTPRQFALEPNGKILLVTNTDSGQLKSVNLAHLP
jgi:6-phosphogluconolactonase (cycloisomerase 2 family)